MSQVSDRHAVVLLSGGLDSATTLARAKADGFHCHALTVRYGQRHSHELIAAQRVADSLGICDHKIIELDLRLFGGSALTTDLEVPKDRREEEIGHGIPITYVPARNTIFLSLALAWAETLNAFDIYLGVNCTDYSGYPDCRPEYLRAFETMANLATAAGVEGRGSFQIHAPLLLLSKADTIRMGVELGLDYGLTHTCYDPSANGSSCGHCDACQIRLAGFRDAGLSDPIEYQE